MTFIDILIKPNKEIVLKKFLGDFHLNMVIDYPENYKKVCFLDLETTGLNLLEDKIIEIALKLAVIDCDNGELLDVLDEYQSFNDPLEPIAEKVTKINSITNDMVKGHSINWVEVNRIVFESDIIIAHNAGFDRSFMDRYFPLSMEKLWACSVNDIDWLTRGFNSSKQELLCYWHGFYFDAHRAMNDVDALIHLLTHNSYKTDKPILELIKNSQKPIYKVSALNSAFETKDKLKANGYFWNNEEKYWWKNIEFEEVENEQQWLTENIYDGYFAGAIEEVSLLDRYKI